VTASTLLASAGAGAAGGAVVAAVFNFVSQHLDRRQRLNELVLQGALDLARRRTEAAWRAQDKFNMALEEQDPMMA